jgi:hypothetical protein
MLAKLIFEKSLILSIMTRATASKFDHQPLLSIYNTAPDRNNDPKFIFQNVMR